MPKARSSSGLRSRNRAGLPSRSSTSARLTRSSCSLASLSLPLAFLARLSTRFSRLSRSASISSVSMVSMSASGAILPSTWVMSESSKQRTTCATASTSRMVARNWLPRPSPLEAPRTRPAISTKVSRVGMICADLAIVRQLVEPGIRHRDLADIRLDGAERIIRRLRRCRLGQRVEQRRLADIGQPDDTAFESHSSSDLLVMAGLVPAIHACRVSSSKAGCRVKSGDDEASQPASIVFLLEKSLGLQRQMHLVLKRRVAARREQAGIVGDRLAQRLDPGPVALGEIRQHVAVHQFLDAGMTDPEPHPAIVVADMRGDRAQPVVAGNAAADLDAHLRRRQFEFVLKHGDLAGRELEEVRGFLHRAPGLVHVGRRPQQDDLLAIERAFRCLALKAAAPWCETMTPRNFIDDR